MNAKEIWLLALAILMGCTEPVIPPSTPTSSSPIAGPVQADGQAASPADTTRLEGRPDGGASDPDAGEERPLAADAANNEVPAPDSKPADAGIDAAADAADVADATPAGDGKSDAAAPIPEIIGTWFGEITGRTGNRVFSGCVVISQVDSPGPAGTSEYIGDTSCRTNLEYVEITDGVYTFNETMTGGTGCPRGYLHLRINPDHTMRYEWFVGSATMSESLGTLSRTDECPKP
jgi:hypothetical protein